MNTTLGGAQVQLSAFDKLASTGKLGNVYGPGGGFKKSPLAGSLVTTASRLDVDPSHLGTPADPVPLSDAAVVKTSALVSSAQIAAAVAAATGPAIVEGGPSGGSAAAAGDASGTGDGGDGGDSGE